MSNPPLDLTRKDGGQPASCVPLTITFDQATLSLQITGPLANRTFTYMLLAGAKDALDAFYAGQQGVSEGRILRVGVPLPTGRG